MKKLTKVEVDLLKEKFYGKRIFVDTPKGSYAGMCTFIGYNEFFPSWGFQVTIDRTPITNVDPKKIGLFELFEDGGIKF
jgi:hypothetical protein